MAVSNLDILLRGSHFSANDSSEHISKLHDVSLEHCLLQGEEQEAVGGGGECSAGSS